MRVSIRYSNRWCKPLPCAANAWCRSAARVLRARARSLSELGAGPTPAPYVLNLTALGSRHRLLAWLLWRIRRGRVEYWMLVVSVAVDAVGCFASLFQTVLWPSSGASYRGLLTVPDISALLVIVYCAGFRVWPRLAVLGALFNLVSYVTLVTIELALGGAASATACRKW